MSNDREHATRSLLPGAPEEGAARPNLGQFARDLVMSRLGGLAVKIAELWNPQTCPEVFLPWLAWALSVDEWRSDWSVDRKRAEIAAAVRMHRIKGTVASVREMAERYFGLGNVEIVEGTAINLWDGTHSWDGSIDWSGGDTQSELTWDGTARWDGTYHWSGQRWTLQDRWAWFDVVVDYVEGLGNVLTESEFATFLRHLELTKPVHAKLHRILYRGTATITAQLWYSRLDGSTGEALDQTATWDASHDWDGSIRWGLIEGPESEGVVAVDFDRQRFAAHDRNLLAVLQEAGRFPDVFVVGDSAANPESIEVQSPVEVGAFAEVRYPEPGVAEYEFVVQTGLEVTAREVGLRVGSEAFARIVLASDVVKGASEELKLVITVDLNG